MLLPTLFLTSFIATMFPYSERVEEWTPTSTLFTHTLLLTGRWSLTEATCKYIYIYIYIFWPNRPRANWLSRKNYYSLSHFSPSVDFLSLSLSLCTLNFLPLSSYQSRSTPSQTTQVNCRERAPICELLSQREICSDL